MKRTIAITDCRIADEMLRRLMLLGFEVITLPPFPKLSPAVASHTDMLLLRLGNEFISTAEYCDVAPQVFTDLYDRMRGEVSFTFTSDRLFSEYPTDCRLNVLVMGKYIFAKTDTVSPYVLNKAIENGLTVIPVRQGYPACTVLRLNDRHAITADEGMAKAMRGVGISVTMIENGGISLPPHDYGFIGGCASVYGGRAYFLGNPTTHISFPDIESACRECGIEIVSLGEGALLDLGGIIFTECNL